MIEGHIPRKSGTSNAKKESKCMIILLYNMVIETQKNLDSRDT